MIGFYSVKKIARLNVLETLGFKHFFSRKACL